MSELAYENATLIARLGYPVFPSGAVWGHDARSIATSDLATLEAIHNIDPKCDWRIRCSRDDGILALGTSRACDAENLIAKIGPLPRTLMIARPSGSVLRLYATGPDDPELRQTVPLFGFRAWFRNAAPVPGSRDKSGEIFEWRGGTPEQTAIARLTDEQLSLLPKTGGGVTAEATPRWEWTPTPAAY